MNKPAAVGIVLLFLLLAPAQLSSEEKDYPASQEFNSVERSEAPEINELINQSFKNYSFQNLEEDYTSPLPINRKSLRTECCAPEPFIVNTNRFGLRESNFSVKPDDDTKRILVIGDAYTWGFGVNRSDRYTDVLEHRLENTGGNYEVINAGVPNWGMKNYYLYLKRRGIEFQPDIVVIGTLWNDQLSWKQMHHLHRGTVAQVRQMESDGSKEKMTAKITEREQEIKQEIYREVPANQTGYRYLYNIDKLLEKNKIEPIYFALDYLGSPSRQEYLQKWEKDTSSVIVHPPETYLKFPERLANNTKEIKYRVSTLNSDPNQRGHVMLAETLLPVVKNQFNNSLRQIGAGSNVQKN